MKKPDLRRIWETYVRIPDSDTDREMSIRSGNHIEVIRRRLIPMISGLTEDGTIDWYCFLIYDRRSEVPTASPRALIGSIPQKMRDFVSRPGETHQEPTELLALITRNSRRSSEAEASSLFSSWAS